MIDSKHWIALAGLVLAASAFALLGRWQLDRAEVNRAIERRYLAAADLPVLERPVAADRLDALGYRRIELQGRYLTDKQILLDNMTRSGRIGYEVLTPFRLDAGGDWVLVNRGWVPASPERGLRPDVALAAEAAAVTGRLGRLPRAAFDFEAPLPEPAPVVTMSFPTVGEIETVLGHRVHDFVLLLDPGEPAGYLREWAPRTDRDERNVAYAVQWFGLSALALVLAVGMAWRARRGAGASR